MNFQAVSIDNIQLKRSVKGSYEIKSLGKNIEFWTPELFVPFGLESKYNDYFLNLELIETRDPGVELFQYFIVSLEEKLLELLGAEKEEFNSQLRNTEDNTILYTKLLQKNSKILTEFKNSDNENLNIFNLEKRVYVKLRLFVDRIWFSKNRYFYKYKIKEIVLV